MNYVFKLCSRARVALKMKCEVKNAISINIIFLTFFYIKKHLEQRKPFPHALLLYDERLRMFYKLFKMYNMIYYIDMSVLPKNRQLVFSIRNYIRDTSEIFPYPH